MIDLPLTQAVMLPSATATGAALAQLEDGGRIGLITTGDEVVGMADATMLTAAGEPGRPLVEMVGQLPPTVTMEPGLEPDGLAQVAICLQRTSAPAVIVRGDADVRGVVTAADLAEAIELTMLRTYRSVPTRGARAFVCRKCVPEEWYVPRTADTPPACPRNFTHGEMERAT